MSLDYSNGKNYLQEFFQNSSQTNVKDVFIRLQKGLGNNATKETGLLNEILYDFQKNTYSWTADDLRFGIKPLLMMAKHNMGNDQLVILFVTILIEIIQNYSTYLVQKGNHALNSPFILHLVECSCHVVVKVISSSQEYHDVCYQLLQLCKSLLISSRNSENLLQLSASFYNAAGLLYKHDLNSALRYAKASESVYKEYITLENPLNESWMNLAKKQDMVASILLSLSQKGDGMQKWMELIQSIPVKEWMEFSEDSSNSYLLKTFQRYVKAVFAGVEEHIYIIDLIEKDLCKEESQYRIMEYELNALVALHDLMNTSKLQIPLLRRMIDLNVNPETNPRYLIRLLIC